MTDDADLMTDLDSEGAFEVQMRGYSRRQVDEFVARSRSQVRELEERLSHSLDETERVRLELTAARQGLAGKPAHEEISERVGQILKLADDEAKAQRNRAQEEIGKQREDAKKEADRIRTEAREQTERMLTAAQEQAENAIATARAEADKMRNSARLETERAISEASKDAENTIAAAKAQAKQMLDEATVRASAIHDGAERRLNLLTSRHTETMRRLTEIRDVVTNLVASETSRGSLEDEVAKSVASSFAAGGPSGGTRQGGAAETRRGGPTGRAGAREPGQERDKGTDIPAAGSSGHLGQHPGSGHDTRPAAAARPARPDNGSGEPVSGTGGTAGTGENVRVLPE
ncbi:MAG TPA: ATP synthase F0 subunit B [Streptosporangiaceae bacterium]|nr:ATP synthase F0 subunit B [Streptosporangiaceae bacterium]